MAQARLPDFRSPTSPPTVARRPTRSHSTICILAEMALDRPHSGLHACLLVTLSRLAREERLSLRDFRLRPEATLPPDRDPPLVQLHVQEVVHKGISARHLLDSAKISGVSAALQRQSTRPVSLAPRARPTRASIAAKEPGAPPEEGAPRSASETAPQMLTAPPAEASVNARKQSRGPLRFMARWMDRLIPCSAKQHPGIPFRKRTCACPCGLSPR